MNAPFVTPYDVETIEHEGIREVIEGVVETWLRARM